MDISILKQELLDKKLKHFYIFTGEELALQDIYIDKIKEISGYDISRLSSVNVINNLLFYRTMIKTPSKIFVIRNDEEYIKNEKLWDKLINSKDFKGNILILLYSGIETSKFIKQHEQFVTKFDLIGTNLLVNRMVATTGMPKQYCEDIVKICGNNYGRIRNELYKLYMLSTINKYSVKTAYLQARKSNFIHEEIGDIIFDFTDAIVTRNIKKTFDLLPKIWKTEDGASIKLLSVLYNQFRQVLMVQTTALNEQTEQVLGLTKGQIYITSQKCNFYTSNEVVKILRIIRYLEKGIKIGTVEDKFAIDYLLTEIW